MNNNPSSGKNSVGREISASGQPNCLFAYGTLCDPDLQKELLGHSCEMSPAVLRNYKKQEGKWSYLLPEEESEVRGKVLFGLCKTDLEILDDHEVVHPKLREGAYRRLYVRELVEVDLQTGQSIQSWVYKPYLPDWPLTWR